MRDRLATIDAVADWEEIPDFLGFIQKKLGTTVLEAITGPQLLVQNPTFVENLFKYDSFVPIPSKGIPRGMAKEAYKIRDKMLFIIKIWHAYGRENHDEWLVDTDGDFDPFWGSEHIRYRQKVFSNVNGYDHDLGLTLA